MTESTYAAMRAYIDVAVELQVTKRLSEVRAALPVETRAADPIVGPAGKDGAPGKDGVDGKDGKDGERGAQGERGVDGHAGRDGAPSTVPGPRGEQGARGADGIATLAELESIVEARFAELQVRTLADSYREVYRSGEQYRRGEVVTWGGSLFLAMADTTDKPETTPSWRLVVKHGRDGARK